MEMTEELDLQSEGAEEAPVTSEDAPKKTGDSFEYVDLEQNKEIFSIFRSCLLRSAKITSCIWYGQRDIRAGIWTFWRSP
jgi:hypothetical protein